MSLEDRIRETAGRIPPPNEPAMGKCRARWDGIAKPLGGLGRLEEAVTQIAGIQRTPDIQIRRRALVIMCADNGVVEEGVTQSKGEVTGVVAENFISGRSCVSAMCRESGIALFPVDIGMEADVPCLESRKVAYGTKNMAREPAMAREQALAAMREGIQKAYELKEAGFHILATGEMGIGNTTTAAAMAAVLLGAPAEQVAGRGAGLSSEGLEKKTCVIRQAIRINRPDPADPVDVLAKVGGFDIAGLAGVFLGGACCGMPVVIDGLISSVAALLAVRMAPACAPYMLPSHLSNEPAAELVLSALGKEPFLTCGMSLGEGSGAVLLFLLLDSALRVYEEAPSFAEVGLVPYQCLE